MKEYNDKSVEDLMKLLGEKQEAERGIRFGTTGSKARNVKEGKSIKKEIARILTELNSRKNK